MGNLIKTEELTKVLELAGVRRLINNTLLVGSSEVVGVTQASTNQPEFILKNHGVEYTELVGLTLPERRYACIQHTADEIVINTTTHPVEPPNLDRWYWNIPTPHPDPLVWSLVLEWLSGGKETPLLNSQLVANHLQRLGEIRIPIEELYCNSNNPYDFYRNAVHEVMRGYITHIERIEREYPDFSTKLSDKKCFDTKWTRGLLNETYEVINHFVRTHDLTTREWDSLWSDANGKSNEQLAKLKRCWILSVQPAFTNPTAVSENVVSELCGNLVFFLEEVERYHAPYSFMDFVPTPLVQPDVGLKNEVLRAYHRLLSYPHQDRSDIGYVNLKTEVLKALVEYENEIGD